MTPFFSRGPARALFVLGLALILSAIPSLAQVLSPPPPAEYRVVVRYHIRSGGQTHVARFREMVKFLQETKGITQTQAYQAASMAADLHITQLVDGNVGVHMMIAKAYLR